MDLLLALSPILLVSVGALLLMLVEAMSKNRTGFALGSAAVLFTGTAAAAAVATYGPENLNGIDSLAPWYVVDHFTLFFSGLLCFGGGLAALLAGGYLPEHNIERGEFYALLLFSTVGAMMVSAAGDALTLFLGLETMSLGAYAMTAFRRASQRSMEAAIKYFLLGSFAAALLLFGFSLLYGATGHTDLIGIGQVVARGGNYVPMIVIGLVLVLVGLCFKVSAVPFHAWTPDAYEGAPTPATTYMASVVKAGAFAMLLRVLMMSFSDPRATSWATGWPPVLATLAVLTMTVANLVAGRQESVKRMLAYSSIAHAGYLLVGVVAAQRSTIGISGVLFYLLSYTVSTAGAFGALILCGSRGKESVSYEDLAGIGRRHPAAALPFALFCVSLAGVPPTAGFFGKWYVFKGAMEGGYYWLTIIAFVNSVIGAYYYLRVLVYMYMREPAPGAPVATPMRSGYVATVLVVCAFLVLALGLAPDGALDLASKAKLATL